jgi:site-specific DNA-methyltransferase (adenine-specific)
MTYPEDFVNKIICGDSLEVMKGIPDKCVDVVVMDPPYGVNLGVSANNQKFDRKEYDSMQDTPEFVIPMVNKVLQECFRLSDRVVMTPGVRNMFAYPKPDHVGSFFYPAASGTNSWGFSCWQPIYFYGKDPYGGKGSKPDSFKSTEQTIPNGHPCPKPLNQWRWLLGRVSLPGEIVLDPFIGSGTTARAAIDLGRKFIGIEISPEYCKIATDRLRQGVLNF